MGLFSKKQTGTKIDILKKSEQVGRLLVAKLGDIIVLFSRISHKAAAVDTQSKLMVEEVSTGTQALEKAKDFIESISNQIHRQTELVQGNAGAVEEITVSIQNVEQVVNRRQMSIDDLSRKIDAGGQELRGAEQAILDVFKNVEAVKRLSQLIEGIAAKTNLLALNAAIEAARSGEAGRGFTVVANEIRDLSKETSDKAKDISDTLETLVKKISLAQKTSRGAGEVFEAIEKTVADVSAGFAEITRSTADLSLGTKEVLSSTSELRSLSQVVQDEALEAVDKVNQASHILEGAAKLVHSTQREMMDVTKATAELASVTDGLNQLTTRNNDLLKDQNRGDPAAQDRLNYSNMLGAHFRWLSRMRTVILAGERIDSATLGDHTTCALGKWLETTGRAALGETGGAGILDQHHKHFHQLIGEIAEHLEQKNLAAAETTYSQLIQSSEKVAAVLIGHQILPIPEWTPAISVGVTTFDEHHRRLLALVRKLKELMMHAADRQEVMKVFQELLEYTVYHFSAEEKAFEHYNYPEEKAHREAHKRLVDQALALKVDWENGRMSTMMETLEFLTDWVINHILGTDRKYDEFFRGKKVEDYLRK